MEFPARADRLKPVRDAVRQTAIGLGCSPDIAHDIVIAVDEACQNIIRHAYGDTPEGDIVLQIRHQDDNVVIMLRDFAATVDASGFTPRPLDELRPGGLGTHLMSEVMDEVEYMTPPSGDGNLLRMVKRIP